jgi:hypothetical protein
MRGQESRREAEPVLLEALSLGEQTLGPLDFDVAEVLRNLGNLYQGAGASPKPNIATGRPSTPLSTSSATTMQRRLTSAGTCGSDGISVFVVLDGTLEEFCRSQDQIRRYGEIRLSTVARLHGGGFALLATGPPAIMCPDNDRRLRSGAPWAGRLRRVREW